MIRGEWMRFLAWTAVAIETIVSGQALTARAAPSAPPGGMLSDSALGERTFDERFDRLDSGADQARGPNPHRWRTVSGFGGAAAFDNRKLSSSSVGVDREFGGVENGRLGGGSLGLDPFELRPGGGLAIVARPTPPALLGKLWNARWYSGQITTKFSFSQRYGYFEAEAKLPSGKGLWPQFWLMPVSGQWPLGGEIDIFEGLGDPRTIYTTLHWAKPQRQEQRKVALPFDASADFHRYGVAWDPKAITWYVDRRPVMAMPTPPEVNQPMYILLGLAVGGPWGGFPDATTAFPARFAVRRIQVWKLKGV